MVLLMTKKIIKMKHKIKQIFPLLAIFMIPFGIHFGYPIVEEIRVDSALARRDTVVLAPLRGRLLAADGRVLAWTDTSFWSLHLDCLAEPDSVVWKLMMERTALGLDRLVPREDTGWSPVLAQGRQQQDKYLPIAVLRKEQLDSIRALPLFRPSHGGIIEATPVRVRPFGSLAEATIGTLRDSTWTGLEKRFDWALYGVEGLKVVRSGWYEGKYLSMTDFLRSARPGKDIKTTLMMDCQAAADSILRSAIGKHADIIGGCLVMTQEGAIRAICNLSKTEDGIREAQNWAIERPIGLGRIADALNYAALLSDGLVIPASSGGDVTRLVQQHYEDDLQAYVDRLRSFLPNFDLDMAGNHIPAPGTPEWTDGMLAELSCGRAMAVTPLSLLAFVAGIGNDGKIPRPSLMDTIVDEDGSVVTVKTPDVCGEIPDADAIVEWMKSAGNVKNGFTVLSGVSRGEATSVGFACDEAAGCSIICTLFMKGNKLDSRISETTVFKMFDVFNQNR